MQAPAFAVIVVAALAFAALLAGVLVMQSRGGGEPEVLSEDQRTGDLQLDEVLGSLVSADESAVRGISGGAVARRNDSATGQETIYQLDEWMAMLTGAVRREVYAVMHGHPQAAPERDFEVYLRVVTPNGEVEGWRIAVGEYQVVDIYLEEDLSFVAEALGYQFEQFVVLPPVADRPKPPASHDLAVRTGDAGIDPALEALAGHDAASILSLVGYERTACGPDGPPFCDGQPPGTLVEAVSVTDCNRQPRREGREFIEPRLTAIAAQAAGIVGVARLPEGYVPVGDALVIVLGEEAPYAWEMNGLAVESGRIVGLVNGCSPREDLLYPPSGFVVLPPAGGLEGLDAGRRSGNGVIDAFLDALAAGDISAMQSLTRFEQIECVTEQLGIGAPPLCLAGERAGTVVRALLLAQCEGHYSRAEEFPETLARLAEGEWSLYAVLDLGSPDRPVRLRARRLRGGFVRRRRARVPALDRAGLRRRGPDVDLVRLRAAGPRGDVLDGPRSGLGAAASVARKG